MAALTVQLLCLLSHRVPYVSSHCCCLQVLMESREQRREALRYIAAMKESFPEVLQTIKTHQLAQEMLLYKEAYLKEIHKTGVPQQGFPARHARLALSLAVRVHAAWQLASLLLLAVTDQALSGGCLVSELLRAAVLAMSKVHRADWQLSDSWLSWLRAC